MLYLMHARHSASDGSGSSPQGYFGRLAVNKSWIHAPIHVQIVFIRKNERAGIRKTRTRPDTASAERMFRVALRVASRQPAVRHFCQFPELTTTKSGLMYRDVHLPEPDAKKATNQVCGQATSRASDTIA